VAATPDSRQWSSGRRKDRILPTTLSRFSDARLFHHRSFRFFAWRFIVVRNSRFGRSVEILRVCGELLILLENEPFATDRTRTGEDGRATA
jgi:hypothetical protein